MKRGSPELEINLQELAAQLHACVTRLFPICRSITGDGVRETLSILSETVALDIHNVPSGAQVLDWTIPNEWNIRDAWIKDASGQRVIDFRQSNLHVLNYSTPVKRTMSLEALKPHLFTLPEQPDRIPYRTSYYVENWGFCLSHAQFEALPQGDYEVCIDATLAPGNLCYGEQLISGGTDEEILISCHICHPSMANDNLSGMAVAVHLARHLQALSEVGALRYSYRFLFIPAAIGSIAWLSRNPEVIPRIRHGLVLACLGDSGAHTYKRSRRGNTEVDRAAADILKHEPHSAIRDFSPYGYDERQYCSPGFNLPMGRLTRTPNGEFTQYHTDADNLEFVKPEQLAKSLLTCFDILQLLERNRRYLNQKPYGEPQLGKYGLYSNTGGSTSSPARQLALLWVLSLSDGEHSLLDICQLAELPFAEIANAADALAQVGLLTEA
ncbi:DUF4910 domain-containing protein [Halieaceae bacterium IMCC14734]|uniref:DUF4910 domain-containing protein n=1 Tax=Candidatus Litorirhabdus singularis TaxID=2518993 RepID=A0ABT3THQ4_9GAMM|nr:DUF4910 domain-containing protein [Candidatus Litorirhabdus singularis]MCX2980954.1 DUF4910 domain-containing protein [Candidatus Litorirhabdus singularis]